MGERRRKGGDPAVRRNGWRELALTPVLSVLRRAFRLGSGGPSGWRVASVVLLAFTVYFQATVGVSLSLEKMTGAVLGQDTVLCVHSEDDGAGNGATDDGSSPHSHCVACIFARSAAGVADFVATLDHPARYRDVFLPGLADDVSAPGLARDFDARGPPLA
jgi:hypothetical protein